MNMIRCAADGFGDPIRCADQSTEIFVQTRTPRIGNERVPIFCAEDDVVVQAYMG